MAKYYSKADIIARLKGCGIKSTDTVFFTTSLGMLGLPPKSIDCGEKLNQLFLDAMREVLKDGNILVPTYSYTFGKSTATAPAIYDPQQTPAEIGDFPNYVLNQKDVVRSLDPFMSIACIGKDAEHIFAGLSNHSYGKGSFFEKMVLDGNMKCCSIGLGPNWTPFIHYADWLAKAPHRYDKLFHGYIKQNGQLNDSRWIYSVAFLGPESYASAHKIGRLAEAAGIWLHQPLGRARVYVANCQQYFNFTLASLQQDPWLLTVGPAVDVAAVERKRLGDDDDRVLDSRFTLSSVKTGQWLGGWLTPERWVCKKAQLLDMQGQLLSSTSYLYSLGIDQVVDVATLQQHISKTAKNVYLNRDWGFVYDGELLDSQYRVVIVSAFGYGSITIARQDNKTYALLANTLTRIDDKMAECGSTSSEHSFADDNQLSS